MHSGATTNVDVEWMFGLVAAVITPRTALCIWLESLGTRQLFRTCGRV